VPLRLDAIAKTSLSHRPVRVEWGAGVTFPIGLASEREERASTTPAAPSAAAEPTEDATSTALGTLQRELVDAGFENVRVGVDGTVVVVEYENDVYSHAEVDALGVVLGHVAWRAPPGLDRFAVVLERTQLPLAEISGPLSSLRAWFGAAEERGEAALPEVLALSWHPRRRDGAWWDDAPARRSALRSQLVLAPGLVTYVATEISALEYVLSLRPELRVPLWPGALAYGRWDVPFVWSAALADGGALRSRRAAPRLVDALLYQALPLAPGVTALAGAGVFQVNGAGGLGEVTWTPGGGDLALAVHGAFTRVVQGADTGKRHESLVASVRWRYAPLALVATVSGGRFYEGDRGAEVELARWFRDTSVGVFYAHTGVSVVGVRLTLPLTPRREMTPGLLQVRGTPRWEYDVFSVVQHRTNDIVSGVAVQPVTPWNLEDAYRDASRLTLEALARDLPRARAAFQRSLE
jgi:hypothetical protein